MALPVLPIARLLPTRRPLLASPVAADIIKNLFVLDQVYLIAATNALLSNVLCASRVQAGLHVYISTYTIGQKSIAGYPEIYFGQSYMSRYTGYILRYTISLIHTELYGSIV